VLREDHDFARTTTALPHIRETQTGVELRQVRRERAVVVKLVDQL
jgi:hypothetical protein